MASVRDTVFKMLTEYPSLFKNKSDCYDQLFLTNGNGYDWIDGELVSWPESKNGPDFREEEAEIERNRQEYGDIFNDKSYDGIRLRTRRNNSRIQFALDNFDLMMEEPVQFYGSSIYYSGWEYNKLTQMPDDVKDDWKEAILDCVWALGSYVYQTRNFGLNKKMLDKLERDMKKFKKEKFPVTVEQEKERLRIAKEIIDEIKEKEKNKDDEE